MTDFGEMLRGQLNEALGVLVTGGDAADAERRAKAVSALVRAEREVAELLSAPRAPSPEEDEESLRAELRRRIARFVEADQAGAPDDVLQHIGTTKSPQ